MSYATVANMENVFGKINVRKWADLNNTDVAADIETRIEWALDEATSQLNDRLRRSVYQFPLEAEPFPSSLVLTTCYLAGLLLYESRGLAESEDAEGYSKKLEKRVDKFVYDIINRRLILDVAISDLPIETSDTPFVVNYDEVPYGQ